MDPIPSEIRLRKAARLLVLSYDNGQQFELPFEYLRVHSPSAEVRGHGAAEPVLVTGKEKVQVRSVEPIGHYAVRLVFDDGHDSGLYTWSYLYELGTTHDAKWTAYLERVAQSRR